uniref:Interleukin n=1 Tax=Cyclopterus lumpus TaxID=8103 RepID=A0A8C2ZEW0_CYCLU
MGYFIRIAFWITLSGCLLTNSFPISDFGAYYLRKHVECPSESTFYAPRNVEKRCITTALDCVRRELSGTVREECEDPREYVDDAVEYLDLQIEERSGKGHVSNLHTHTHTHTHTGLPNLMLKKKKKRYSELTGPPPPQALTDSRECACERWPETSFSEFVGDVLSLLELENSDSNP